MSGHSHLYGDSIADVYDRLCPYHGEVDTTVDFLAGLCPPGGSVLEFGVGTGRLALPLAGRGLRVHGVDASQQMLAQLAAKDPAGQVTAAHGDMTDIQLDARFDLVLLAYNTLCYAPEQADQVRVLRNAAAHLADGGKVVLDLYDPGEFHLATGQQVSVQPLTADETLFVAAQPLPPEQHLLITQTICGPGQVRNLTELHRYCWPAELDLMAQLAGLRREARYADWSKTPAGPGTHRYISVYAAGG